jgi:hypothetical protein
MLQLPENRSADLAKKYNVLPFSWAPHIYNDGRSDKQGSIHNPTKANSVAFNPQANYTD